MKLLYAVNSYKTQIHEKKGHADFALISIK